VSYKSIDEFLESNKLEELLKMGEFPSEFDPDAVFNGFPHLAVAYEDHLKVLNECF